MTDLEQAGRRGVTDPEDVAPLRYRVASTVAVGELAVGVAFRNMGSGIPLIFQLCRVVEIGVGQYEEAPSTEATSGRPEDETSLSDARHAEEMYGVLAAAMQAGEFADILPDGYRNLTS